MLSVDMFLTICDNAKTFFVLQVGGIFWFVPGYLSRVPAPPLPGRGWGSGVLIGTFVPIRIIKLYTRRMVDPVAYMFSDPWFLLLVVVVVVFFLMVVRDFWTWYFKLNSLVRIEELLKQVLERLPGPPKPPKPAVEEPPPNSLNARISWYRRLKRALFETPESPRR